MKPEERMTTKTRRRYTDEFKAEAVRLVTTQHGLLAHSPRPRRR
jgi:transposase-like protein